MFSRKPPKVKPNQALGKVGEGLACAYLKEKGFAIVVQNFRTRWGEIDIIASRQKAYYFVEVKTRHNLAFGSPLESLPYYRVRRLQNMANYYATVFKLHDRRLHLSLIGIDTTLSQPKIDFVEDIIS